MRTSGVHSMAVSAHHKTVAAMRLNRFNLAFSDLL